MAVSTEHDLTVMYRDTPVGTLRVRHPDQMDPAARAWHRRHGLACGSVPARYEGGTPTTPGLVAMGFAPLPGYALIRDAIREGSAALDRFIEDNLGNDGPGLVVRPEDAGRSPRHQAIEEELVLVDRQGRRLAARLALAESVERGGRGSLSHQIYVFGRRPADRPPVTPHAWLHGDPDAGVL